MSESNQGPTWLLTPPGPPDIAPPAVSRQQLLPFGELQWENFERLCLQLARFEGEPERWQLYGKPGQAQEGIDILVRMSSGQYRVWQAKRHKTFSVSKLRAAVGTFLDGRWRHRSVEFVLAVQASLRGREIADEIEAQFARLKEMGIQFNALGGEELSERLKTKAELVDSFFGRPWVEQFCGPDAAALLKPRLTPGEIHRLRTELRNLYRHHFNRADPGFLATQTEVSSRCSELSLESRYVVPDMLIRREVVPTAVQVSGSRTPEALFAGNHGGEAAGGGQAAGAPSLQQDGRIATGESRIVITRQAAFDWLVQGCRSVVLGDPGTGKTSLLRIVAMELLSEQPSAVALSLRWSGFLPLWIPFSLWTRLVEKDSAFGLETTVKTWLDNLSALPDLWPLVERSLKEEKVLLLIDGIDEWANQQAAHTAVNLLCTFVARRQVPVIVSGRPLGYRRLSPFDETWQVSELAPFTRAQQGTLARHWLSHYEKSRHDHVDQPLVGAITERQTETFLGELERHPQVARLAETPLLLWVLISMAAVRMALPQNRFKAYEQLLDVLLSVHPARRKEAALEGQVQYEWLSIDNRERALAYLAYRIQQHFPEGTISRRDATQELRAFFRESLDLSGHEALQAAEATVSLAAESIGIVVERSRDDIGFRHRALQEFLAARYVVSLPLNEQKAIAVDRFRDPQWRDLLLSLLYLTRRPSEADELTSVIECAGADVASNVLRDIFLAEAAFGNTNISPRERKRLADRTYRNIEDGWWPPLRRRLLHIAIDGLHSDVLRHPVRDRIGRWFPNRHQYRGLLYDAVAQWPAAPETLELLWHGLTDEESGNQRSAGKTLAIVYRADEAVGAKVTRLLRSPREPLLGAAALSALVTGWPQSEDLSRFIADASQSTHATLRLAAIAAKIRRREQTAADKTFLVSLARDRMQLDYHWREDLVAALLDGWPGDEEIRDVCLEAWTRRHGPRNAVDTDISAPILMRGYSCDAKVTAALANLFAHDDHPHIYLGHFNYWEDMKSFRGNTDLAGALESWLERRGGLPRDDALAALVAGTEKAKQWLLATLEHAKYGAHHRYWVAWALLEGWGMADPDVARQLSALATAGGDQCGSIAELLPAVILDPHDCRSLFFKLLEDTGERHLGSIVRGVARLGVKHDDKELLDALLARDFEMAGMFRNTVVSNIIQLFKDDGRVRQIALAEIRRRDGAVAAVALAYAGDAELRNAIAEVACPLPAELRQVIVDRLRPLAREDGFSRAVLAQYDDDCDAVVKTAGATAYYGCLIARGEETAPLLSRLADDARAIGPDMDARRQAALAGLLALKGVGLLKDLRDHGDRDPVRMHAFSDVLATNFPLRRFLVENWDILVATFGKDLWDRLEMFSGGRPQFEKLAPYAGENALFFQAMLEYIGTAPPEDCLGPEIILAVSRMSPRSVVTRQLCLQVLRYCSEHPMRVFGRVHTPLDEARAEIAAAEVIASQFAGDSTTHDEIAALVTDKIIPSGPVIALCDGWPASKLLDALFERLSRNHQDLLLPAQLQMICLKSNPEVVLQNLDRLINNVHDTYWAFWPSTLRPIINRAKQDEAVLGEMRGWLDSDPTCHVKASIPRILSAASGLGDQLRRWCEVEVERLYNSPGIPDSGFDVHTGRIRPIVHTLLEILDPMAPS